MTENTLCLYNGVINSQPPADNRGLAYGDGLFETVRVAGRSPQWLDEHFERLLHGCEKLKLQIDIRLLSSEIEKIIDLAPSVSATLKIVLFRRSSGRGYAPQSHQVERLLLLSPAPPPSSAWRQGVALGLCNSRITAHPALMGIKHLNRLEQVLAAGEMQRRGFAEGLMLDARGHLAEGTRSNLFLVSNGKLLTPDLSHGGIVGVMRKKLITRAQIRGIAVKTSTLTLDHLRRADEVLVCNSVFGIWPVTQVECLHKRIGPVTRQLQAEFEEYFFA